MLVAFAVLMRARTRRRENTRIHPLLQRNCHKARKKLFSFECSAKVLLYKGEKLAVLPVATVRFLANDQEWEMVFKTTFDAWED